MYGTGLFQLVIDADAVTIFFVDRRQEIERVSERGGETEREREKQRERERAVNQRLTGFGCVASMPGHAP